MGRMALSKKSPICLLRRKHHLASTFLGKTSILALLKSSHLGDRRNSALVLEYLGCITIEVTTAMCMMQQIFLVQLMS